MKSEEYGVEKLSEESASRRSYARHYWLIKSDEVCKLNNGFSNTETVAGLDESISGEERARKTLI